MVTEHLLPVLQHKTSHSHPKPTAILLFSDLMTLPLIRVLRNAKIHVPENISVVSFGGWALTQYLPISVWTWAQSVPDIFQTLLTAVSASINVQSFYDELPLPHMLRDWTHAVAHGIEKHIMLCMVFCVKASRSPHSANNENSSAYTNRYRQPLSCLQRYKRRRRGATDYDQAGAHGCGTTSSLDTSNRDWMNSRGGGAATTRPNDPQ